MDQEELGPRNRDIPLFTPEEQAESRKIIARLEAQEDERNGETQTERLARILKEERLAVELREWQQAVWNAGELADDDPLIVLESMGNPPAHLRRPPGPRR